MPQLQAAQIAVTPFQQNCALIWDAETQRGVVIDPGGDVPRIVLGVVAKPVQKRIDFSTVGDNGGAEGSDASAADGGGVHEDGSSRSASSSSAASAPSPEGGAA